MPTSPCSTNRCHQDIQEMPSTPLWGGLGADNERGSLVISKISPKVLFSVGTGCLNPSALFPPLQIQTPFCFPTACSSDHLVLRGQGVASPTLILSLNPPYCQVWTKLPGRLGDLGEKVQHRITDHWYSEWLHRVCVQGASPGLAASVCQQPVPHHCPFPPCPPRFLPQKLPPLVMTA